MSLLVVGLGWLVIINIATWAAFADDKQRARQGAWRVPESLLLSLSFLGGSGGALLAQRLLRHKTRKEPFASDLRRIAMLHVSLLTAAIAWQFV